MESHGARVRARAVRTPVDCRAGDATAKSNRSELRRGAVDVWRVERTRKPTGSSPAGVWSRTRIAGGSLPGAFARDDGGVARHSQSRRRLSAAGPGVSGGTSALHVGGCRRKTRVDAATPDYSPQG